MSRNADFPVGDPVGGSAVGKPVLIPNQEIQLMRIMTPTFRIARLVLTVLLPCSCRVALAQELSLSWANTYGHPANANLFESGPPILLSDTNGNTRLFGFCHGGKGTFRVGTNVFPATIINGTENQDIYMARLDSRGNPLSVKLLPSTGRADAFLLGAAMDLSGNVVMVLGTGTGGVSGSTLAGIPLPDNGGLAMVKVDANDEVVWGNMFGGRVDNYTPGGLTVRSVAVDLDGNLVVGGYFQGMYDLDGVILDAGPIGVNGTIQQDIFVAKFSAGSGLLWVRTAGGLELPGAYRGDSVEGVASDSAGNVFIGGTIVKGASFDGQIVNTVGDYDVFAAKYLSDGSLDWVFTTGTDTQTWLRFQGLRVSRDDKPILVHTSATVDGKNQLRLTVLDSTGNPGSVIPPVLTSSLGNWIPFVGMEVSESNDLLFVASGFAGDTLQFGSETLSPGPGEERLVFGGSLKLNGTWNWLLPIARPRYATNATPERYFLPGTYSWGDMRGFTAWQRRLRFAGVYLSPEPFPMADGTLPTSSPNYSQFFVAELAVKPSPPMLTATSLNASLRLAWPSTFTNFVLQSATTLSNGGDWQDSNLTSTESNGRKVVTLDPAGPRAFFRLRGL